MDGLANRIGFTSRSRRQLHRKAGSREQGGGGGKKRCTGLRSTGGSVPGRQAIIAAPRAEQTRHGGRKRRRVSRGGVRQDRNEPYLRHAALILPEGTGGILKGTPTAWWTRTGTPSRTGTPDFHLLPQRFREPNTKGHTRGEQVAHTREGDACNAPHEPEHPGTRRKGLGSRSMSSHPAAVQRMPQSIPTPKSLPTAQATQPDHPDPR